MSMLRGYRLGVSAGSLRHLGCMLMLVSFAACTTRLDNAPIADHSSNRLLTGQPLSPPPPGYYRVKPGDTLYRIALDNGQNYRDIAAWSNLPDPNRIEVGQLLRVVPPGQNAAATSGTATAPVMESAIQTRPLDNVPPAAPPPAPASSAPASAPAAANVSAAPSDTPSFGWPVHGPILNTFDGTENKGVNIGGAFGSPVLAAANGRVVYAGALHGYGNLIIIKHNALFLTAYGQNSVLLAKEGEEVKKGQKIAEMGNSDSDRIMLHFEVRMKGKPDDPLKYLPPN